MSVESDYESPPFVDYQLCTEILAELYHADLLPEVYREDTARGLGVKE